MRQNPTVKGWIGKGGRIYICLLCRCFFAANPSDECMHIMDHLRIGREFDSAKKEVYLDSDCRGKHMWCNTPIVTSLYDKKLQRIHVYVLACDYSTYGMGGFRVERSSHFS